MSPGTYDVTIKPKGPKGSPQSSRIVIENAFTIMVPEVDYIDQANGAVGDLITIYGLFFGSNKGQIYLTNTNGKNIKKPCKVYSWTMDSTTGASKIVFVVPKRLPIGNYSLIVKNAVGSATGGFTVQMEKLL
jgi:hypothetical protein